MQPYQYEVVSTDQNGLSTPSSISRDPVFSSDGKDVFFSSNDPSFPGATPGPVGSIYTNGYISEIYEKNLTTDALTLVSTDTSGQPLPGSGQGGSNDPAISSDGTYVAFNDFSGFYVKNLTTNTLNFVNGGYDPVFSPDGSNIAYFFSGGTLTLSSGAYTLPAGYYSTDLDTDLLTQIATGAGEAVEGGLGPVTFSGDGTEIAFRGFNATDPNYYLEVYVKNLTFGTITLASVGPNGPAMGDRIGDDSAAFSDAPAISPDGTEVAFVSNASNLIPGLPGELPAGNYDEVFLKNLITGSLTLMSSDASGVPAEINFGQGEQWASSLDPVFSPNGKEIAFASDATNFGQADAADGGIYIKDLTTGAITLVSDGGGLGGIDLVDPGIAFSPDGTKIAFNVGYPYGQVVVVTITPALTSIAASGPGITSGSGDVFTGNTVTLTAQFSAAVTVDTADGTPFLQLNDGGTASYAGGSGTATLTFVYTVAAGQQTTDLAMTGLSPNGGTVQDAAGNAATFAPSAGVLGGTLQVNEPNTGLEQVTAGNALVINTALTNGKTGTLDADGGSITITGAVTNAGTIKSENGGTVTVGGNLTGSGTTEVAEIFSGSEIELQGKFNSAAMAFQNNAGDTGVLVYDHSAAFGSMLGTVAGFSSDGTHSDTLDLKDIDFASGVSWSYNQNKSASAPGGILTVKDHMGDTANINLLGQYLAAGQSAASASPAPALSGLFTLAADGSTGTLVTTSHHG